MPELIDELTIGQYKTKEEKETQEVFL